MRRILVVDDDTQMRRFLCLLLQGAGYEAEGAEEGKSALAIFKSAPFDLVVLDLIMPGMDGLETLMHLRELAPHTKVIAISGGGKTVTTSFLPAAEKLGATHTLEKPFTNSEFLLAVRTLLEDSPDASFEASR